MAGGEWRGAGGGAWSSAETAVGDALDDVAGVEYRWLGEAVADGRSLAAAVHEARGAEHGQVLACVGEWNAEDRREVADGALAVPQGVEQPESLGIREDLADLGVEPISLEVCVGGHDPTISLVAQLRN